MMKHTFLKLSILFFSIVLVTSCSVDKRIYRKGYHVVWNAKHSRDLHVVDHKSKVKPVVPSNQEEAFVSVSVNSEPEMMTLVKKPVLLLNKDTCGDVLLFKNGEKLLVKVLQIENNDISYKRCDNLSGPTFIVSKKYIAILEYVNGVKENLDVSEEVKPKQVENKPKQNKVNNGPGIASFILSVLGFIVGITLVFAIPLAILSKSQIKKEPDRYVETWLPTAALIISAIFSLILTLIFYIAYVVALTYGGVTAALLGFLVYFAILALASVVGLIVFN
jgi:hypothetical protein